VAALATGPRPAPGQNAPAPAPAAPVVAAAVHEPVCPDLAAAASRTTDEGDHAAAVLEGHVLDPDTEDPVADAHVTLSWVEIRISRSAIFNINRQRETTSDARGEFQFCALPAGLAGTVQAHRAVAGDSGVVVAREVELGTRALTMTTLHLPVPVSAASAGSAPAEPPPDGATAGSSPHAPVALHAAVLVGRVQRPDGRPVPGALALVEGTGDSAVANDDGIFTIRGLPSGTHMLAVRSVGFEPTSVAVELTRREIRHVTVAMMNATYVLSPVIVQAQQLALGYANVGFSQRRREGVGQYLTLDDITSRHPQRFSDLFTMVRGVRLAYGGPAGTDIEESRGIGGCLVYVIDGEPFNRMVHGELDAMLAPESLAGIEIYSPPAVPEQFRVRSLPGLNAFGVPTMGTTGCTTVVIWTKTRLGVKE